MSFTGKATYSAGATLPEIAEDVSDLVSIVSPHETPLLSALGEPSRVARSTVHEWLEDSVISNLVTVATVVSSTVFTFDEVSRLRVGDQLVVDGTEERLLITAINTGNGQVTVSRAYGASTGATIAVGTAITNLGNAALEGGDAIDPRFTNRVRKTNYTQIFTASCEVSGSELAVKQLGVRDELDHQKTMRLRELLRDLENSVVNGVAPAANPQGSSTVRRTMRGLRSFLEADAFIPDEGGMPSESYLTESMLNYVLRSMWERAGSNVDLLVVNGREKRRINEFVASSRRFFSSNESFKDMVSSYESDFGLCRIVLSRYVPSGTVLLLDSSRIDVLPLAGRSFHYKPLASTGDRESGQLIGEYTLEVRSAAAHGMITGLTT
jgi:hypothetical protein